MRIRCRQPPKGEQLTYSNNGRPQLQQFAMRSLGGVALTNILAHQPKIGYCIYCYYRLLSYPVNNPAPSVSNRQTCAPIGRTAPCRYTSWMKKLDDAKAITYIRIHKRIMVRTYTCVRYLCSLCGFHN